MYSLILSLVLSGSVHADRLNVQVDDKDCVIKVIQYNEIDNIFWAIGNCQEFYNKCEEDYCKVERLPQKDLTFRKENVGNRQDLN